MAGLTPEQWQFIEKQVQNAARQVMVGRQCLPLAGPIGFGKEVYGYDKLTEFTKGKIDLEWGVGFSEEIPNLTRTKVPLAVLHKEFRINRRQVEASRTDGTPLDATSVDAATYAVARQEDDLILLGYSADATNYDISGLYNVAGNSEATSLDYGTVANILTSVNNALALLEADSIVGPYNQVLNPTQYRQTFGFVANTSRFYHDVVLELLGKGGQVFSTPAMTAAKGVITGSTAMRKILLALGQDLKAEYTELEKSKDIWGIVYETAGIAAPDANWSCQLTTI